MNKHLRQIFGLFILLFLMNSPVKAQYLIDDSNPVSYFSDISATGAPLGLSDDGEGNIVLPFDFKYFGVSYTAPINLRVGNNGGIIWNTTVGNIFAGNDPLPSNDFNAAILPFWDDLDNDDGNVYWEIKGIAPNRTMVIQWDRRPHFSGDDDTNTATLQLILTETTHEITFDYSDVFFNDENHDNGNSATVGLQSGSEYIEYSHNMPSLLGINSIVFNPAAGIECRQPVSTTATPGDCAAVNLEVLTPLILSDLYATDNTTITRIPAGDDFPIGTTTLTWTVSDGAGNSETCESLVIVEDDQFPVVGPCDTEIVFTNENNCLGEIQIDLEVTDNCGIVSVTGLGNFTRPPGLYDFPVVATDVNGNVTTHIVTVEVHDDFAPVFNNCPTESLTTDADANGIASYPVAFPTAFDNCDAPTVTNDIPETGLTSGENVVTFTANDAYGNWSNCTVIVEVTDVSSPITALHSQNPIASSLTANETTQTIVWNALNAETSCESCQETSLSGFRYVGTWWGHQYFLADELSMTHADAKVLAESYDAHLAVITTAEENAYLTDALGEDVRSAWIGLEPQMNNGVWNFAWENGELSSFEAFDSNVIDDNTRIILSNDGTWQTATTTENKYMLIERPCVNLTQTGPIYETEGNTALLRSGDAWPQGEYEVTYTLTDMCGDESTLDFPVSVTPDAAEYCTSAGTDNSVWIEKIVFHELTNETIANEGYGDFTQESMTMNIGDGVVLLQLDAGGNEAENTLYWKIYLDSNNDGDFFDADELIYEAESTINIQANLTLPVASIDAARLRVMVSRHPFTAPCGDTSVGEVEDYNLTLLVPEDYARAACEVQVAGLNGERNGSQIDLDWTVNSACPIVDYNIEYSNNGSTFTSIQSVNETDNSSDIYNEFFAAQLPEITGNAYYRVRVQPEGFPAFYTNTVSVNTFALPEHTMLFPNPADSYVTIDLTKYAGQKVTVRIYDNYGKLRLLQKSNEAIDAKMTVNLNRFIDGIYHVSISAEGKRNVTQRLVINKLYGWDAAK